LDAEYCEYGVMLSESSGIDVNTASGVFKYTGDYESSITQSLTGLKPDKSYYCRPYIKYKTSGGNDEYMYGTESSFSTMTSDQMWVDLGLPSGIRWANCDLGHYEFVYSYPAPYYQWGAITPLENTMDKFKNTEWYHSNYEYWDSKNNCFINIGQEISGTEYDAASHILGGKWRMPTKADVDELIANCDLSKMDYERHTVYIDGATREVNAAVGYVVGNNGNEINFNVGGTNTYWCSTLSSDDNPYSFIFNAEIKSSTGRYIPNTGWIEVQTEDRAHTNSIRPVWDPNMPD